MGDMTNPSEPDPAAAKARKLLEAIFGITEEGRMGAMAGNVISGTPGEPEPVEDPLEWRPSVETVWVETENFSAEAIPMFMMPALSVLDAMTAPEHVRVIKMFELFKLSINDQEKLALLEILSYQEFNQMVAKWLTLSSQLEEEQQEQRRAQNVRNGLAKLLGGVSRGGDASVEETEGERSHADHPEDEDDERDRT